MTKEVETFRGNTLPYSHIGRPNNTRKPTRVITHHPARYKDPNFWQKNKEEHEHYLNTQKELALAIKERDRLDKIIQSSKQPLIDRIYPNTSSSISLAERLSEAPAVKVDFWKHKLINRRDEYRKMLSATGKRIAFIRSLYPTLKSELFSRFNHLQLSFEEDCRTYSHRNWRHLRRDCKAIKVITLGKQEALEHELKSLVKMNTFIYKKNDST